MDTFNKFSCKLFGVAAVFYTIFGYAIAAPYPSIIQQPTMPIKICTEGYYLSHCGDMAVGTNWLKGIKGTTETPDYYSYDSDGSDSSVNAINLRKFFAGLEPISYRPQASNQSSTVLPSDYVQYRNQILATFCTNGNNALVDIQCKKCPNNAKVSESTVERGNFNGLLVEDSWNIHTMADCYMDEFSDNTGTYVYAKNDDTSGTAQRCYISNSTEGSELVLE